MDPTPPPESPPTETPSPSTPPETEASLSKVSIKDKLIHFFKKIWPYEQKTLGVLMAIVFLIITTTSAVFATKFLTEYYFKNNKAISQKSENTYVDRAILDGILPKNENSSLGGTDEIIGKKPSPTLKPETTAKPGTKATPTPLKKTAPTVTPTPKTITNPTSTPASNQDKTAPVITSMTGPENSSTVDFDNFCFPIYITDNVSNSSSLQVRVKFDSNTWGGYSNNFSPCYSGISNGSHTFSVQAKDAAGNESSVITRTFTVAKIQNISVSLNGQVYADHNCNNSKDEGENGVSGMIVDLMEPNGSVHNTSSTDSSGNYSLSMSIPSNTSIQLIPLTRDHNGTYTPGAVTLHSGSTSQTVNISSCQ